MAINHICCGHFSTTHQRVCVQIEHPNWWRLHLKRCARIFQIAGVNKPQAITFVNARSIYGHDAITIGLVLWLWKCVEFLQTFKFQSALFVILKRCDFQMFNLHAIDWFESLDKPEDWGSIRENHSPQWMQSWLVCLDVSVAMWWTADPCDASFPWGNYWIEWNYHGFRWRSNRWIVCLENQR